MAGHACHFPPSDRVYAFFRRWRNHDLVREFHDRLRRLVRERAGRDSEPGAGVIDSQSVKADAVVGSDSRGFDGGKLTNGRKRHVVVDTLGLLLAVMVTAADVGDRAAAQVLLTQVTATHHLPALVWADGGRTHRQPRRVLPRCPRPDPRHRQTQPTREFPDPGRHPTGGSPLATGRSNTAGARTCATARQQCDSSAGGRPRGPEQHPFLCTGRTEKLNMFNNAAKMTCTCSRTGRTRSLCVLREVLGWRELRSCRAVLALTPVAFALVACGRFAFPPVPDGKPAELSRSQAATVWGDGKGGRLELKPDGTFTADDVCGDYDIDAYGPQNEPRSGSGTWDEDDSDGQSSVTVSFEADRVSSTYEALRDGKTLKLWTYVGDPDDGHSLCVLTPR